MIEKLYKIAEGLDNRFQDGDNPFFTVIRLAEGCGEVARQMNYFERKGDSVQMRPFRERARKWTAETSQNDSAPYAPIANTTGTGGTDEGWR